MTPAPNACIVCDCILSSTNDSQEHVIPNSVGGRLKVREFICISCNSSAGASWDAELARQAHSLSLFFGITRERGEPPPLSIITTAGEEFNLLPGGGLALAKPSYTKIPTETGAQISVTARDLAEAKRMLAGIKRKYPNIDVDAVLKQAAQNISYAEGAIKLDLEFGGVLGGRSLVKTSAAFAHHCGVPVRRCTLATSYLRDTSAEPCFGYYYQTDLVKGRTVGLPLHCLAVSADPVTGLVLGYVEYFGALRIVSCLSETYDGPPINRTYGIDPLTGTALDLNVTMSFSKTDLAAIYAYEKCPLDLYKRAYDAVISVAMARKRRGQLLRIPEDVARYAFANCGAKWGETLSEEQRAKLAMLAQERLAFLLQRYLQWGVLNKELGKINAPQSP